MPTLCLDCRYVKPLPSGIGEIVRALVDHLPALAPDWKFVFLRHASLGRPLSAAANVTEIELSAEPNGPTSLWGLSRATGMDDFDLFHAPSNILPRGITIPCVTTLHDIMWLTNPALCNPRPWGKIERVFYRQGIHHALSRSAAIVTVSEATRGEILSRYPTLAGQTHAVLPGVSDRFHPRQAERSRLDELGLPHGEFILCVGQGSPYKNPENALRAFAAACADRPDTSLAIVQRRATGGSDLASLARQLGIAGQVHFLATVGAEDLLALYAAARALLHPSLCEGFGMPLAEAMASGCPVITSNRSAMPEVVAGAAAFVDPTDVGSIANAITRVLDEPELAETLRAKGLQRARELDWRDYAIKTLSIYRHVLGLS